VLAESSIGQFEDSFFVLSPSIRPVRISPALAAEIIAAITIIIPELVAY
jgi:hypothetical protein